MKRSIITFLFLFPVLRAVGQDADTTFTATESKLDFSKPRILISTYFDEVKAHTSREARKEWRPEFTVRGNVMIFDRSVNLTGGVRTSARKVFGLGVGWGQHFFPRWDGPGRYTCQRMTFSLYHRHYIPLGHKQRYSLYGDWIGGGMWVYKAPDRFNPEDYPNARIGWREWLSWQPGLAIRTWGRSNFFIGLSFAYSGGPTVGWHAGITF